jgi:RNA polymerase sigma factor (sigma-70 family)
MMDTSDMTRDPHNRPQPPPAVLAHGTDMASTLELLERFKSGDQAAIDLLVERSIPPLRRWARGRLPAWARSLAETQDVVQNALLRALPHLKHFEARHPGALQAYLRQAVANYICDEVRRAGKRPPSEEPLESQIDPGPSPLETVIGREAADRYEAALAKLRPADREAIIARIELQQSYEEIAIALQKPSANAARVSVSRAIKALVRTMADAG